MKNICLVPNCTSTKREKQFFFVTKNRERRPEWFRRINVRPTTSGVYICQDHFDLQNDTINFMEHTLTKCKLRLKPNALPSKCLSLPPIHSTETEIEASTTKQFHSSTTSTGSELNPVEVEVEIDGMIHEVLYQSSINNDTFTLIELNQLGVVKQEEKKETNEERSTWEEIHCAICKQSGKCTNIFDLHYHDKKVDDLLLYCTGLKLKTDTFAICYKCSSDLIKCYQFITMCRELPLTVAENDCNVETSFTKYEIKQEVFEDNAPHFVAVEDYTTENTEEHRETVEVIKNEMEIDVEQSIISYGRDFEINDNDDAVSLPTEPRNVDRIHTNADNKEEFKCDVCGRFYSCEQTFKAHRSTHSVRNECGVANHEKRYECWICRMKFLARGGLKKHLRVHLKDKPFICKICGKSFKTHHTIKYHHYNVHKWQMD